MVFDSYKEILYFYIIVCILVIEEFYINWKLRRLKNNFMYMYIIIDVYFNK